LTNPTTIEAPLLGAIVAITVSEGDIAKAGSVVAILEAMKVQSNVVAPHDGVVTKIFAQAGEMLEKKSPILAIEKTTSSTADSDISTNKDPAYGDALLNDFLARQDKSLDEGRAQARDKRHAKGYRTARENLIHLSDEGSFVEYGQLAIAAQRGRVDLETLQSTTAADGIITGVALVNSEQYGRRNTKAALIVNDYSVLAGTQGYYHHMKLDRILEIAKRERLPVIMYTEGGGGRPGDTDITTVNSGLGCESFASWAALDGVVLRIAVANGYNFAGNAALFGAADITIATRASWIGMAGPAMISGGGLGDFKPTEIGPIDVQQGNSVVDLVADDEQHATELAKICLGFFQDVNKEWTAQSQVNISEHLPDNRKFGYEVRDVIKTLADDDSFIELKQNYGGAIITGLMRLEGRAVGVIANDCKVLGGAIDVDAGEKAATFMTLCEQFSIPLISLADTPGFMVGPDHEELGAVRRLAKLFTAGAKLTTPLVAIVLRKCYGLGAQAMVGGSTTKPNFIAAWPTGEFGPMGLEGAVQLGFKKELDAETDPIKKQAIFDELLAQQYSRGQASEVATTLEIDAVIDPKTTRDVIISSLFSIE
jgi:acetyl-CoA carboxylase carboxyltransferase component